MTAIGSQARYRVREASRVKTGLRTGNSENLWNFLANPEENHHYLGHRWADNLLLNESGIGRRLPTRFGFEEIPAISTNFRHNHQIRISPIRLIDANDEQLGIVSTSDALRMATEASMDLVEVAPNARPPVCKIMDYGKWRYQQQKKEDKSRASNKGGQLKELKFKTVKIGDHDLQIKINHAKEFLQGGNKVQFTLQFRGREMAHQELGRAIFKKIKDELFLFSKIERDAKMEGRRMTLVLQPDHKNPDAVRPVQGGTPPPARAGSGLNIPPRPAAPAASPVARPAPVAAGQTA